LHQTAYNITTVLPMYLTGLLISRSKYVKYCASQF